MNLKAIIIFLLILVALGLLLQQKSIQDTVLNFLNNNIPWFIPAFAFIKDNVATGTLTGLFLYLLFVNIPLLPSLPAEAYILFSFLKEANIFGILFITVVVYMFFATLYYFVGRFFGKGMLERILKRPVEYNKILDRIIAPLIFFVFMLPIPLPIPAGTILVLLSGFYKTDIRKVTAAVGMGTLFRVLIILALYYFYTPLIQPYLTIFN